MSRVKQVAVLGMGRLGMAVAYELMRVGYEVLAVDRNERVIREVADKVTHAVQADITDLAALRDIGIRDFDTVVVAVAGNLEASILSTVTLKRLGVSRIVARAGTEIHGSILEQVGANRVVYPERETGMRLAHSFGAPGVRDYLDVAPGYGFARVPPSVEWIGKTLGEIDFHRVYRLTVVALRRGGSVTLSPHGSEILRPEDELIVGGLDEDLARLPETDKTAR